MGCHEFIDRINSLLLSRARRVAQRWFLALSIAAGCLLSSGGAAAFLIDHFHHGPFTVTDPGGGSGTAGLQTGLPADEVMGGSRREWITLDYDNASYSATAHLDGGGDVALSLTNIYATGWYQFDWDVSQPVDLTHGGVADRFEVNITGFPNWRFPTGVNRVNVEVWLESVGSHYGQIRGLYVTSPGMMQLPFSALTCCVDLTQIVGVTLLINFANVQSGAVRVSSIATAPEPPPAECSDGADNDGDGLADFPDDPGCADAADLSEHAPDLPCDDGAHNDADGLADYPADPGCFGPTFPMEDPPCDDGLDNDGDLLIDFGSDPYCEAPWFMFEGPLPSACGLGIELVPPLGALLWLVRRRRHRLS
jgi:hypothetical protein